MKGGDRHEHAGWRPKTLINIAHVVRNKAVTDIIIIGTIDAVADRRA